LRDAGNHDEEDDNTNMSQHQHQHQHEEQQLQPPDEPQAPTEQTTLLRRHMDHDAVHPGPCDHGTFSPRPMSPMDEDEFPSADSNTSEGSSLLGTGYSARRQGSTTGSGGDDWVSRLAKRVRSKKMSQTSALASSAGFQDTPGMYFAYYIPGIRWISQYQLGFLQGDLVAGLTMASMYLPMALSLADNLAHVPPIHGLYSFVFTPLLYAFLGSCPSMVVGPEAPGSLLVGSVIKSAVDAGLGGEGDDDVLAHVRILSVVVGMAGATVLAAGLARLGFVDNVLSKPFLRGFVSAIGVVVFIEQLIPELGLIDLAEKAGVTHSSAAGKLEFVVRNFTQLHKLTFVVAAVSFLVIMAFREIKGRLQKRYPSAAFFPDRLIVIVVAAILAKRLDWASQGVEILGTIKAPSGGLFTFQWPFTLSEMARIRLALPTSFLIALLGFFESSVAAKSLGSSDSAVQGMELSANRELVALGTANIVGACFTGLPAFGGYGRSRVNLATGGKTPMSSVFLSFFALLCVMFFLPFFYYIPKPVLCAMISVVGWSLVEEAPHDIVFFLRIRSWSELSLMAIIFFATLFYSLTLGMAIGVGLSMLRVIHHSTRPRIQILGRIPGTNRFENAELEMHRGADVEGDEELERERLEFFEGCMIVKIPEPLTFANTGELKSRLGRLERYGTGAAHPALPRLRGEDSNRNVIFDIHGVTSLDGAGVQVLEEIVRGYRDRGTRVFFTRGPWPNPTAAAAAATATGRHRSRSGNNSAAVERDTHPVWIMMERAGIVDLVGGESHFLGDVEHALRMTEALDSQAIAREG
jgi:high affinity sulfate transporter 1